MRGDIDIANFPDGNMPDTHAKNIDNVMESSEQASVPLFKWIKLNLLKGNADKCHFLTSTEQEVSLNVDNLKKYKNSESEKILGVKFDSNLTFDKHISDLFKRASRKVSALARMALHMNSPKRRLLMDSFFKAQFK